MVIRAARAADLDAVEAIYDQLHTLEEEQKIKTGWIRHVYPTRKTAEAALALGTLYVLEDEGAIRAAAKIDQEQPESYFRAHWTLQAEEAAVLVLHTLVVDPTIARRGRSARPRAPCKIHLSLCRRSTETAAVHRPAVPSRPPPSARGG